MKKNKAILAIVAVVLVAAAVVVFFSIASFVDPSVVERSGAASRRILFYRSPMHPWITSKEPGNCTVCGMRLAPVFEGDADATGGTAGGGGVVRLSPATASVIGVGVAAVRVAPLRCSFRVSGVFGDDETRHRVLSARVGGRIEKLHVNQVGLEVAAGQPLATLYSPEVLTAQRLYLENRRVGGSGAVSVSEVASSRERLLALGLEEEDVARLERDGKPDALVRVRAPFAGTVISRRAYEGQYTAANDALFEIGDFSSLWFIFDASERDLPLLALNQRVEVQLPSRTAETLVAPISFIDPNLDPVTRTARVRVVLPNPARRLFYRQTSEGVVRIETPPVLLVPRGAVLQTRGTPVAYVETAAGTYERRPLALGRVGDADAEVLSGLREGERVVAQAALLVDNQAQLEGGDAASVPPEPASSAPAPAAEPHSTPSPAAALAEPPRLTPAFLEAVLDATEALAADDFARYTKALPAVEHHGGGLGAAARAHLAPLAAKLAGAADIAAARRAFEPFSNAAADIVRALPPAHRGAHVFQCRMSPVLGTARWLQRGAAPAANPFFGAAMLACGEELH